MCLDGTLPGGAQLHACGVGGVCGCADFCLDMLNAFTGGAAQNINVLTLDLTHVLDWVQAYALKRINQRKAQLQLVVRTNETAIKPDQSGCLKSCGRCAIGLTPCIACAERLKSARRQLKALASITDLDAGARKARQKRMQDLRPMPVFGDLTLGPRLACRPSASRQRVHALCLGIHERGRVCAWLCVCGCVCGCVCVCLHVAACVWV